MFMKWKKSFSENFQFHIKCLCLSLHCSQNDNKSHFWIATFSFKLGWCQLSCAKCMVVLYSLLIGAIKSFGSNLKMFGYAIECRSSIVFVVDIFFCAEWMFLWSFPACRGAQLSMLRQTWRHFTFDDLSISLSEWTIPYKYIQIDT